MSVQPMPNGESSYFFNGRERARLAVYRAAIRARFYTDECNSPSTEFALDLARLLESVSSDYAVAA